MGFKLRFHSIFVFLSVILCSYGSNIETREFRKLQPVKPLTMSPNYRFGTTMALKNGVGKRLELFVGAPYYDQNLLTKDRRSGAVFSCSFNGTQNTDVLCSEKLLSGEEDSFGISLSLAQNGDKLLACSSQRTLNCDKSVLQERLIGACYTTNTGSTRKLVQVESPCTTMCVSEFLNIVDIIFVLDESGSVSLSSYKQALRWVVELLTSFREDVDKGNVHVGVVAFHSWAGTRIALGAFEFSNLQARIIALSNGRNYGGTNIAPAIDETLREFNRNGRTGIQKQMILMTDGYSSYPNAISPAAQRARAQGVVTVAVGVGGSSYAQLLNIAGNQTRVFYATNFNRLGEVVESVRSFITDTSTQSREGVISNTTNLLYECQLGSSAHISKNNNMYIGAVGSFDRTGSVADYFANAEKVSLNYTNVLNSTVELCNNTSNSSCNLEDSYIGYSVTSGNFFGSNNTEYVASGAPRYNSSGAVLIYEAASSLPLNKSDFIFLTPRLHRQIGSYFGHSLCTVDLNNDGLDDLVVSAPLYNDKRGYDQGRAFVFMNNSTIPGPRYWALSETFTPVVLRGSNANGARFGMSVAVVGDVDNNGYDDIAVGAPMEESSSTGSGAVYIYFSSSEGLENNLHQRILGKSVSLSLVQFGLSIMGRSYNVSTDVDGNGYSDVIIASPASDVVVVLYSRPVVLVTSRLEVEPRVLDVIKCARNTSVPCAKVRVCLNGSFADGRPLGRNYSTLEVKLNLDSGTVETTRNRLIFMEDSPSERIFLHKLTQNESCSTYDVQVNVASLSHDTFSQQTDFPIVLKASYDFPASHKSIIMSPVLSPLVSPFVYATCKLETGCTIGTNGNCNSRLELKYSYSIESSSEPLILEDLNGMLTINATVLNRGREPTYTAILTADATLQLLKPPTECMVPAARSSADSSYAVKLQYQGSSSGIPNLLQPGDQCRFILDYPLAELARNATDEHLLVGGILTGGITNSAERVQTFSRPLLYKVDASSQGTSQPNSLFYNRTLGQNFTTSLTDSVLGGRETDIKHMYSVENIRAIRIPIATLVFKWPRTTAGGLPLLYLYEFQCTSDASCICNVMDKVNSLQLPYNTNTSNKANVSLNFLPEVNEAENIKTYGDCKDTICEEIRCTVEDLKSFQRINLVAKFKLWIPSLPQRKLDSSVFSSISLSVRPPLHPLQLAESKVITRVSAFTAPEAVKELSPLGLWPFIASAVGGFVLLLLAVLTLWKCGFFESKYKQKTAEAKGKLAEAAAYTQPVPTDDEQPPKK